MHDCQTGRTSAIARHTSFAQITCTELMLAISTAPLVTLWYQSLEHLERHNKSHFSCRCIYSNKIKL